ncbi:MAG: peptide chain release factor N(5)-glutamine methyltransferase [Proteobacteria bacterium]|nr:peptide chain release factor N(5)-glutamine methyltransferase [Pseudomonadota bacterium]
MPTISEVLNWGKNALATQNVPLLEAQVLLAHVLGCTRTYLYTWPEKEVPAQALSAYEALIKRREQHEPIAYLVGHKEFWSLSFIVSKDTLIPRADTELLISTVLNNLSLHSQSVVDVGTGCGVIACTLAHCRPNWQLIGLDISEAAMAVAKQNAQQLNLHNVEFIHSCWLESLPKQQYDAIIGNPPYIRENDVHLVHGDLPFEPTIALTAGPSGLEAFSAILSTCSSYLKPAGLVAFEHGYDQGQQVRALLTQFGFNDIQTFVDLAGKERVTLGKKNA